MPEAVGEEVGLAALLDVVELSVAAEEELELLLVGAVDEEVDDSARTTFKASRATRGRSRAKTGVAVRPTRIMEKRMIVTCKVLSCVKEWCSLESVVVLFSADGERKADRRGGRNSCIYIRAKRVLFSSIDPRFCSCCLPCSCVIGIPFIRSKVVVTSCSYRSSSHSWPRHLHLAHLPMAAHFNL